MDAFSGTGRAEIETRGSSPLPGKGERKAKRGVRLKGAQWMLARLQQGGSYAMRVVRFHGVQGTPPRPRQAEPKARRELGLERAQ